MKNLLTASRRRHNSSGKDSHPDDPTRNVFGSEELRDNCSPERVRDAGVELDAKTAAPILRRLREQLNMARAELARRLKVKRPMIYRLEAGEARLTLDLVDAIAKALGMKPEVLLLTLLRPRYPGLNDIDILLKEIDANCKAPSGSPA